MVYSYNFFRSYLIIYLVLHTILTMKQMRYVRINCFVRRQSYLVKYVPKIICTTYNTSTNIRPCYLLPTRNNDKTKHIFDSWCFSMRWYDAVYGNHDNPNQSLPLNKYIVYYLNIEKLYIFRKEIKFRIIV